ncbi:hypothetical protein [Paraburkholderia acidipaludis]|uniref:hypothetical protein n=1 Tax=Paraburkholderia acidipaludis TaxID=660537 RepID=UPI0004809726|nr:hypothetical protein [Paraburkholderia acidipaludis]
MKLAIVPGVIAALVGLSSAWSVAANAAPLTRHECMSYPFVQSGDVNHRRLERELRELESVGYVPEPNDVTYPQDIQAAEARLHAKYERDCVHTGIVAPPAGSVHGL